MARNKLAGQPRPDHVKAKISASQRERYRKAREDSPHPNRKRCPRCKKWKDSPKEFGWTKRKLKSGEVVWHARSWCKACVAEKSKQYREKLKREGKYEEKMKEYNANRKERRYRSPTTTKFPGEHNDSLPTGPIHDWLVPHLARVGYPRGAPEELMRRIDAIVAQEYATTALATIDALLLAYGKPELLDELYPLPD